MEPNFRPKQPCKYPKIARLSDSQFVQDSKLKITTKSKEITQDNIPITVRNMENETPKQPRPPKPSRKIDHHSDCSDSEDGKDDQARVKPIDIQDPQPSTSYANESAPLRCPNTYPKVLNLRRGRDKGKAPLANWTSVIKGCGCGIIIDQTP